MLVLLLSRVLAGNSPADNGWDKRMQAVFPSIATWWVGKTALIARTPSITSQI